VPATFPACPHDATVDESARAEIATWAADPPATHWIRHPHEEIEGFDPRER
jgi:hypothetical protein